MTPAKPYYQDDTVTLYHGDCLELMNEIPDGSVDMVMADLPYGTTACKWDSVIPFEPLWAAYRRVCKKNAAIVLTASQPFTSALIASNIAAFKYCWVWDKDKAGNFAAAKTQPLRVTEDVLVFAFGRSTYNPQMTAALAENKRPRGKVYETRENLTQGMGSRHSDAHDEDMRYPTNLLHFKSTEGECNNINRVHPTQKPVALMEYLIRTYTNGGETVLDNTTGSGTTGVACINTGRGFIGIEQDEKYCGIAATRISGAVKPVTAELQLA